MTTGPAVVFTRRTMSPPLQDRSSGAPAPDDAQDGPRWSVLVTAGPTWVYLDDVRVLSNLSSGRTGLTIARELARRGARVTLLHGPGRARPTAEDRRSMEVVEFETYDELRRLLHEAAASGRHQCLVHTAAVSDFRPDRVLAGKTGSDGEIVVRLVPTPKLIDEVRSLAPGMLLVKFKLESGRSRADLLRVAEESRRASGAELLVANDIAEKHPGRHPALLLDESGVLAETATTEELATALADELARRLETRR